jgi:hypothetical protein
MAIDYAPITTGTPGGSINNVTTTTVSGKIGLDVNVIDITLSHTNDSIRLGDGTNLTTVSNQGELHVVQGPLSAAAVVTVSVPTTVVTLLAANANRRQAIIHNDSGAVIYFKYGTGCTVSLFTARIAANSTYELPLPIYTGIITAIRTGGTSNVNVTEVTT